jgi:hypothetical protein
MQPTDVKKLRDRAWHSLSPATSDAAGMTLADLQQFAGGSFHPSPEQLRVLARLFNINIEERAR